MGHLLLLAKTALAISCLYLGWQMHNLYNTKRAQAYLCGVLTGQSLTANQVGIPLPPNKRPECDEVRVIVNSIASAP